MATPVTIRQRDEKRKHRSQNNQQPPKHHFTDFRNPAKPSSSAPIQGPLQNIDYAKDVDVRTFVDFDDWVNNSMTHLSLSDTACIDVTVNKDDAVIFHGKDNFMSTFYDAPFKIWTHTYPSVEFYYEACKLYCLAGETFAPMIQKAKNAAQSKKIASNILKSRNVDRKAINKWKWIDGYQAVYIGTLQKFLYNPELKKQLLDTGNKFIIHCYDKEEVFASGCSQKDVTEWLESNHGKIVKVPLDHTAANPQNLMKVGNGFNLLGYICMRVRSELRDPNRCATSMLVV